MMSLGGGALVLLVYGGFVLQQKKAQVAAPAPCTKYKHSEGLSSLSRDFNKYLLTGMLN